MSLKKIYFIAGLPRSGTTLLSGLLNQNSKFSSGPNSPVLNMMLTIQNFKNEDMYKALPDENKLYQVMSGIIYNYYFHEEKPIVFDKNRGWVNFIDIIKKCINTNVKIVCTVRSVKEVLTSFITLLRKNNYPDDSFINKTKKHENDDEICLTLLTTGIVGNCIKDILDNYEKYSECFLFIKYDDLVNNTNTEMKKIYDFLGEEYFEHSKDNIKLPYDVNDDVYKLEGMHKIRPTIKKISQSPEEVLSENILKLCNTHPTIKEFEKLFQ